jgi:hypothetical protein
MPDDIKVALPVRAIHALLGMNKHYSKEMALLHKQFGALFHEELTLPPARPISKASRAKAHAAMKEEKAVRDPALNDGGETSDKVDDSSLGSLS